MKSNLLYNIAIFVSRILRCGAKTERDNMIRVWALENIVRLPVVFTDKENLQYVLYPNENSEAYIRNNGNYEVSETIFCKQSLKAGMTVFDIGANIGLYSLLFASLVGPEGNVHSFEPENRNFIRMKTNIALNLFSNVTINRSAVYSKSGTVYLNVFPDRVNSWHSIGNPQLADPENPKNIMLPLKTEEVPAVSIDDYCHSLGIYHIDFLKIDVEGAELDVLQGASAFLEKGNISTIMFEISLPQVEAMHHKPEDCIQLLQRYGYKTHSISQQGKLIPLSQNEFPVYGNYVAIKCIDN
jgi:FkbM family methyltransferase